MAKNRWRTEWPQQTSLWDSVSNSVQQGLSLQVLIPLAPDGSMQVQQNEELPDYLPEEESPAQEPDKAVRRVGTGQDGNGWLGAATNFLSRSFYW